MGILPGATLRLSVLKVSSLGTRRLDSGEDESCYYCCSPLQQLCPSPPSATSSLPTMLKDLVGVYLFKLMA